MSWLLVEQLLQLQPASFRADLCRELPLGAASLCSLSIICTSSVLVAPAIATALCLHMVMLFGQKSGQSNKV